MMPKFVSPITIADAIAGDKAQKSVMVARLIDVFLFCDRSKYMPMPALPATILCLVVAITDGDTLKVRCPDQPQQPIRIAEIDAPEKAQPFGQVSRQRLADLCFNTRATVRPDTTDRYGRTVAHVECKGEDAGTAQVRDGMAWVFRRYSDNPEPIDLEAKARATRRGLWADPAPVPPWDFRHQ